MLKKLEKKTVLATLMAAASGSRFASQMIEECWLRKPGICDQNIQGLHK